MWFHRRANEAPLKAAKTRGRHHVVPPPAGALPRAAEGRRTRGIHQAAADEAPLSNAGAFFSTQHVPLVAGGGSKFLNRLLFSFSVEHPAPSMYPRAVGRTSLCL
jgi:hypothetical protein